MKWCCPAEVPSRLGKVGSRTCSEFRGISADLRGNRRPFVSCMICVHFNRFPRDPDRTSYITPRRLPGHVCMSRSSSAAITESCFPAHKYREARKAFHQHTCTTSHAPSHLICSLFRRRRRRPSRRSSRSTYSGLQHPLDLLLKFRFFLQPALTSQAGFRAKQESGESRLLPSLAGSNHSSPAQARLQSYKSSKRYHLERVSLPQRARRTVILAVQLLRSGPHGMTIRFLFSSTFIARFYLSWTVGRSVGLSWWWFYAKLDSSTLKTGTLVVSDNGIAPAKTYVCRRFFLWPRRFAAPRARFS